MTDFLDRVLRGVFKLLLGLALAVFLVSLLIAAIVVVLGVSLWSLITGRKPAPVVMFNRFRQTSQRYTEGVWPGRSTSGRSSGDVVDVQAHEVPEDAAAPAPRSGPGNDPMARMLR